MTTQPALPIPGLRPFALLSLGLAFLLLPSAVAADRGRVHLEDGSTIQGEIVTYHPSSGVTVQLSNGSVIELSSGDVARVEIGIEETVSPEPEPAVAADPAVSAAPGPAPFPAAPSLRLTPRPRLAGPIVLGSLGVLLVAIGAPMYVNSFTYYDTYEFTSRGIAGAAVMGIGGALVISGFGIWLAMRVKARRAWNAESEEQAIRLVPSLGRRHAGLQLTGTF